MMDPQHRLFLECAWEAIEQAGYDPEAYEGAIGVYGGAAMNTYLMFSGLIPRFVSEYFPTLIGNDNSFLTTRVSYKLNLKGPSVTVQTACSTALVAVHTACQSLLNEECSMVLAGGVSVRVPHHAGHMYQEGGVFTRDGHCRAFDARAGGTIFGSGAGIVVLKRLADAIADGDHIYAVIKGSAINNDGSLKTDYTAPSVQSQADVVVEALANAGVEADTISYIEAHGTGTYLGDPIEIRALTKAFATYTDNTGFCAIGSVKTNIGHLDAAAGIAGLIKTALALEHRQIPASLHFETPNPEIDFEHSPFYVNSTFSDWPSDGRPRRAGVTSLGIGGTNAHVILEEPPRIETFKESSRSQQLFLLSAKTETALDTATNNLAEYLTSHPEVNLADVAYTLQVGRKFFDHRRTVVANDTDEAVAALETLNPKQVFTSFQEHSKREVVFMFPGGGVQYINMGLELYANESIFRKYVDECLALLKENGNIDLKPFLYPGEDTAVYIQELQRTSMQLPAIFTIEYALAKLWISWGITPDSMVGHSMGEYTAACLAGVFSLEDALALVLLRGRLFETLPEGVMLGVPLSEAALQPYLTKGASIATINRPDQCTISGKTEAIEAVEEQLANDDIEATRIHISVAAHSEMVDPILEEFRKFLNELSFGQPEIPFVSNMTGAMISADEVTNPDYWVRHLRHTIRFSEGLETLFQQPERILLEVGPGHVLSSFARQHPNKPSGQVVISSLRHAKEQESDVAFILNSLGQIWAAGRQIAWSGFYKDEERHRLPLPTYPFERQRYWVSDEGNAVLTGRSAVVSSQSTGQLPQYQNEISHWFYIPLWRPSVTPVLSDEAQSLSTWVVFSDEACGLGTAVIERLEQMSQQVFKIRPGNAFTHLGNRTFIINSQRSEDYETLFDLLTDQANHPMTIVHMWNVTPDDHNISLEMFDQTQALGLYSLIYIAQALGKQEISDACRVEFVSSGMHEVIGDEPLSPHKSTGLGPCKVIPLEYDNINCRSIDIVTPQAGSRQETKRVNQLLAEFHTDTSDVLVAYRGNHRWVQMVEPVRMDATYEVNKRIREEGVYLITGGLGGIGLSLAGYLAEAVCARLILVGRSSFPARDAWTNWLADHDDDDTTSEQILKLQAIEAMGSEVLVLSADISDQTQMQAVVSQAQASFGTLHGVIHAAGIIDEGGSIQRRTREMAEKVIAAKVKGTLVLEAVLKDINLDFFVLCSSMATVLYHNRFGEVGYVAANSFLDAYTYSKTRSEGPYTATINWDEWREVGLAARAADQLEKSSVYDPLDSFSPSEGVCLFKRTLGSSFPRILVSTRDLALRIELDTFITDAAIRSTPSGSMHDRSVLWSNYAAPENEIEQTITEIWQELLGAKRVGIHDDYFKLGGDSLRAIQIISRLNAVFKIDLSIKHLFEAPTISDIAEQIEMLQSIDQKTTRLRHQEEDSIEGEI